MEKPDILKGLKEMELAFGSGCPDQRDFLKGVIGYIEEPDKLNILKDRVTERLYAEAGNLLYDPTDFFDDLSEHEAKSIKEKFSILITVSESNID